MRGSAVVVLACLVGCGPLVILDEDSESDTGGSEGDATSAGEGSTTGGVPQPTSVGTVGSDDGAPDPTIGVDFPAPGECWQVQPLFEAPDHVGVIPSDQNGDGSEELWLAWNEQGAGPGQTIVYAIDDTGTQLVEYAFDGFLVGIGDINDDTLQDLILLLFEDGPPRFAWAPSIGRPNFDDPDDLDLELGNFVSGFFDATLDGFADGFRIDDAGVLELLQGDGLGSFAVTSQLALEPAPEFGAASPLENNGAGLAVLSAVAGFEGGETCVPTRYHLLRTSGGGLLELGVADAPSLGALHAARVEDDGTTVLYADTCVPEASADTHDVRVFVSAAGSQVFIESGAAEGKRWITVGDFDGDLRPDLAFADVDGDSMLTASGIDPVTYAEPVPTDVPAGDVRRNNVRALDMDGDGRDDVVRGTAISDDGTQLLYERIFLGPC
jgi:hypothetical protein